jgi:hypothetical protein
MSQKSRIIGQDCQIRIATAAGRLATVTAIESFNFLVNIKILTEQYQGEKGNRKDSKFEDVSGSFLVHPEDPEIFLFQRALADKAIQRRAVEDKVVIIFKYTFPSGKVATFTVPEAEFGPVPINSSKQDAYVQMPFTFEAEGYTISV